VLLVVFLAKLFLLFIEFNGVRIVCSV